MCSRLITPKRCLASVIGLAVIVVLYFVFCKKSSGTFGSGRNLGHYENDILQTPKNYHPKYLHEFVPAPVVPEVEGAPGEMGKAVILPESMEEEAAIRFKEHEFNIVVSEMISVNRSLADRRDPLCLNVKYHSKLPTTSIIIIFHNEAWSTLIRSLWSIINRSPKGLVKEIILVDDKSTLENLGEQLDEYVKTLPVHTKVLRMEERVGLIKSRLRGAEIAQGEVLTFLDAHIECSEGWLEPLLSSVTENRRLVAVPVIDIIKDDTFEYDLANNELWGGFDWRLNFKWVPIPEREKKRTGNSSIAPLYTPTMAGGLFSVDKEFFHEIGDYDDGMIIWGSENLEMSFRVWMCGGELLLLPCSRVGHVFRKKTPYTFPGGGTNLVIVHNCNRLVNTWLDDWAEIYYLINSERQKTNAGNVSSRIALREKLNCKNFQWYVNNIYPELDFPKSSRYIGQIQNIESEGCLVVYEENKEAFMQACHRAIDSQVFVLTDLGELRNHDLCIDADSPNGTVKSWKCHHMGGNQKWDYDSMRKTFVHNTGSCLQRDNYPSDPKVLIRPCDGSNAQKWFLMNRNYETRIEL